MGLTSVAEPRRWLAKVVFGLDVWLRRRQGVFEYSASPDCIFRLELVRLPHRVTLSDGTAFAAGDPVAQLHLWNEQMPPFPANRAMLQWAREMDRRIDTSLCDLARFLDREPELRQVRAVRAEMALATDERTRQLLRVARRYGFRSPRQTEGLSLRTRLHREGENILMAFMVLASNPRAFRLDCLRRGRAEVFLPRALLDRRCLERAAAQNNAARHPPKPATRSPVAP